MEIPKGEEYRISKNDLDLLKIIEARIVKVPDNSHLLTQRRLRLLAQKLGIEFPNLSLEDVERLVHNKSDQLKKLFTLQEIENAINFSKKFLKTLEKLEYQNDRYKEVRSIIENSLITLYKIKNKLTEK